MDRPARTSTGRVDAYLGSRIKRRREELEYTQGEVAAIMQHLGCNTWRPATVAACETGRRNLSLEEAAHMCTALGSTLPRLIGDISTVVGDQLLSNMLFPLAGIETGYSPTPEVVERYSRAQQLVRLEDAVLERITGLRHTQLVAQGWRDQLLQAIELHYGHDLLAERDRRVAQGGNKTWVSRRLSSEVADIPQVAVLIGLFKGETK